MKTWVVILVSPLLSALLLAGMGFETLGHIKPTDVEPFHANAKLALESFPIRVGDWIGVDVEQPREAVRLLRPNYILSRSYRNTNPLYQYMTLEFLVVQCKDSRDMLGHYPPNCYPANGHVKVREEPRTWRVGGMTVRGMEYEFEQRRVQGVVERTVVLNFLVIPGQRETARDMRDVLKAAEDYQERYYGAAQFQMVFSADEPRDVKPDTRAAWRDRIFQDIIGARPDLIQMLSYPDAEFRRVP